MCAPDVLCRLSPGRRLKPGRGRASLPVASRAAGAIALVALAALAMTGCSRSARSERGTRELMAKLYAAHPWHPSIREVAVSPDGARAAFVADVWGKGVPHPASGKGKTSVLGILSLAGAPSVKWIPSAALESPGAASASGGPVSAGAPLVFGVGWSPGSSSLCCAVWSRDSQSARIVVCDLASGKTREVASGQVDQMPAWSPDGNWIAFLSGAEHDLWIVRPDGTGARQLTRAIYGCPLRPEWSPDGKSVYCLQADPPNRVGSYFLRDVPIAAGRRPRWALRSLSLDYFTLSPKGREALCWSSSLTPGQTYTYLLPLARPEDRRPLVGSMGQACFSPDGGQIVYVADATPPNVVPNPLIEPSPGPPASHTLRLRSLASGTETVAVKDATDLAASGAWTRRGQIVFTRGQPSEIWVASAKGKAQRRVFSLTKTLGNPPTAP